MKIGLMIRNGSLITSIVCIGMGFALARLWLIAPALLVIIFVWIYMKKQSAFVSASSLLLGLVILAAMGVMADISVHLMLIACTMALVGWDLEQFIRGIAGSPPQKMTLAFDSHHLRQLALAVSTGLVSASLGAFIHLRLPFGVIMLSILVAVWCLMMGIRSIMGRNP